MDSVVFLNMDIITCMEVHTNVCKRSKLTEVLHRRPQCHTTLSSNFRHFVSSFVLETNPRTEVVLE